jgi:hypothetical protein
VWLARRVIPNVRLDALRAPRRTERRFANRMSPRLRAVEHAIAADAALSTSGRADTAESPPVGFIYKRFTQE